MSKLNAKKRKQLKTLVLELSFIILKEDINNPLQYPVKGYVGKLQKNYNKVYNEELIQLALERIEKETEENQVKDREDVVEVHPDQYFEGF